MTRPLQLAALPLESAWSVLNKLAWFKSTTPRGLLKHYYDLVVPASRTWDALLDHRVQLPPPWLRQLHAGPHGEPVVDGQPLSVDLARRCAVIGGLSQTQWLRACPECIAFGYHSVLHQAPDFTVCVVHDVPLRQGCPQCGAATPYWSVTDAHVDVYGCASCRRSPPPTWAPVPTRVQEREVIRSMSIARPWLEKIDAVRLAYADTFCSSDWAGTGAAPRLLNHARAHACARVEPYPAALPAPVNRFDHIGFEVLPVAQHGPGMFSPHQGARAALTAGVQFERVFDLVETALIAKTRGAHLCVLSRDPIMDPHSIAHRFTFETNACPIGAAMQVWRHMGAQFQKTIENLECTFHTLGHPGNTAGRRLEWEWFALATELMAITDPAKGLAEASLRVTPWWEQDIWCGSFTRMYAELPPDFTIFPVADFERWVRTVPCTMKWPR